MKAMIVCPPESELSEVLTNIQCTETGCTAVFPNSACLQMHLIKFHKKDSTFLNKKASSQTCLYYCPVNTCKYSFNEERSELKSFSKMKYLKQHYLMVHKEKKFKCSTCSKSFTTEREKLTHSTSECGVKFSCIACSASYNSKKALGAHCKRKHHFILSYVKEPKPAKTGEKIGFITSWQDHESGRILLRSPPSCNPIENIAAAALSELSWKIVVRGVDKEVQTSGGRRRTPIRSLKKRDSQETQTGDKRPKVSRETQTASSYKNRRRTPEEGTSGEDRSRAGTETQTLHELFPELSNPLDSIILPQLGTSSTQTGEDDQPTSSSASSFFDMKKDLDLDIFDDQNSQRIPYSDHIERLIQSSLLDSRACHIQTQTELEASESFIEPILSNTETQTIQNALDDEYSHNYTQTCNDILLNDFVEFTDIETQTAWANLDMDTWMVSAETQTNI